MNRALLAVGQLLSLRRNVSFSAVCCQVVTSAKDIAKLYKELSLYPSLTRADVGPVITSQYGGKYSNIYTGTPNVLHVTRSDLHVMMHVNYIFMCLFSSAEWNQRDLERNETVKFCRQYIVFHDDESVVYSGASGNCTEIKGEYVSLSYLIYCLATNTVILSEQIQQYTLICVSCQGAK